MNEELLLLSVKVDLGISTNVYDERLRSRLRTAQARIRAEGVTLGDTEEDRDLVIMYAAWLWRYRQQNEPMPRMLRYALNNRILAEKASAGA